ncbi:MAG: pectate lyase, partial [Sphingomonadales bacterium]
MMKLLACPLALLLALAPAQAQTAFPGAVGPAAQTPGGRGGQIIRVTNLNADGPGSFKA